MPEELKELFNIPSPDHLDVADKPICDGTATIHRLSGEANIKRKLRFHYCENVIVAKSTEIIPMPGITPVDISDIEDRLRHPLNDTLVLCHIDEETGYGVFTRAPIECGEIIGIYAGQATNHQAAQVYYPANLAASELVRLVKQFGQGDYCSGPSGVNAALIGGITRFINHMPNHFSRMLQTIDAADHETLCRIAKAWGDNHVIWDDRGTKEGLKNHIRSLKPRFFNPQVEALLNDNPQLASANCHTVCFPHQGFMLEIIVATRRIEANEQLGWDYMLEYWQEPCRQNQLRFFDKNTGKVSPIVLASANPSVPSHPIVTPANAATTTGALSKAASTGKSNHDLKGSWGKAMKNAFGGSGTG